MYIYILLIIVIILLVVDKVINRKNSTPNIDENINTDINTYLNSFTKKEYLLTQTELKFYRILKQITDKLEMNLFCQVSMYELVNCTDFKYFNAIKSKNIDFVIAEKNCKIRLCIELDDYTHNRNSRKKGDTIKNEIFEKTNTPFIRIPVQNYYETDKLEKLIVENMK